MSNKEKLIGILNNPNNKLICVDLDGTLCEGEFRGEGEPTQIIERIEYIKYLYERGGHIIIYTARATNYFTVTIAWLIKHGVKFHGIAMQQKPGADLYIDDKCLNIEDLI